MKLDELHVRDRRARTPRHRHAVAGRHARVGCVEINLAAAAGGKDHAIGADGFDRAAFFIEHVNADAAVPGRVAELAGGDQVDRHVIGEHVDARVLRDGAEQRALDFAPGGVARMEDAAFRVAALLGEVEFVRPAVFAFVEMDADVDQLADRRRAFGDDRSDNRLVAQPRAGVERVRDVQLERVVGAGDARDAALRVGGVRLGRRALGDDRHAPEARRLHREAQPGDAAADDDEVVAFHFRVVILSEVFGAKNL